MHYGRLRLDLSCAGCHQPATHTRGNIQGRGSRRDGWGAGVCAAWCSGRAAGCCPEDPSSSPLPQASGRGKRGGDAPPSSTYTHTHTHTWEHPPPYRSDPPPPCPGHGGAACPRPAGADRGCIACMAGRYAESSGQPLGCIAKRCAQEPPPSSALFACLPKPHHLVWLKSGLGPITTCLRPFWWKIFTFVRNGPFSRIFYTPPSCWKGSSAPFLRSLCAALSALEPPFCTLSAHPLCAGTPFLHPFCTPFVRWNPLSAPFLRGGFCAKDFCKKGTKCIHRVQIWLLKRACSAFFFGPLWPRQGQAFAGPLGVVTPPQGSPCSIHG